MKMGKTIAEVPGKRGYEGRLGLYLKERRIHFEYDDYWDPDDPESQLCIRGDVPVYKFRKAIQRLQKVGYCTLSLTSGTLELRVINDGLSLYHRPAIGTGLLSNVPWTIERLII